MFYASSHVVLVLDCYKGNSFTSPLFRVSFELEPGAVGQTTDFKESNRRLEWSLKKAMFNP